MAFTRASTGYFSASRMQRAQNVFSLISCPFQSDMFTLGCTLYQIAVQSPHAMFQFTADNTHSRLQLVSPPLRLVLESLTGPNPFTARDILDSKLFPAGLEADYSGILTLKFA